MVVLPLEAQRPSGWRKHPPERLIPLAKVLVPVPPTTITPAVSRTPVVEVETPMPRDPEVSREVEAWVVTAMKVVVAPLAMFKVSVVMVPVAVEEAKVRPPEIRVFPWTERV